MWRNRNFIKHLSHLIVKSETGVKVSVVYWGNKFTETVWDDGISVIPINQPHKSPFLLLSIEGI